MVLPLVVCWLVEVHSVPLLATVDAFNAFWVVWPIEAHVGRQIVIGYLVPISAIGIDWRANDRV